MSRTTPTVLAICVALCEASSARAQEPAVGQAPGGIPAATTLPEQVLTVQSLGTILRVTPEKPEKPDEGDELPRIEYSTETRDASGTAVTHEFQLFVLDAYKDVEKLKKCDHKWITDNWNGRAYGMTRDRSTSVFINQSNTIVVCAFEKVQGAWQRRNLRKAGVREIRLIDKARSVVAIDDVDDTFKEWLDAESDSAGEWNVASLSAADLFDKKDSGRWERNALVGIQFILVNTTVTAWMHVFKSTYFHFSTEVANTYGFAFGDQGRAVAMPIVFALGADVLYFPETNFYIGHHVLLSPTIKFAEGKVSQFLSLAVGGRIDLGGYVGLGAGYIFNFEDQSKGNALIFLSIGPELLNALTVVK